MPTGVLLAIAAVQLAGLGLWGALLDGSAPLDQFALWGALQVASVLGASIGFGVASVRARTAGRRVAFALACGIGWRLAYFPIMVFSGHVASIGEWLLVLCGLPIIVYPVFLLSVLAFHSVAALAATFLVAPPHRLARPLLVPAFAVAALVSFNQLADLRPLPDTLTRLDAPVPAPRVEEANPYLAALGADGYWPNQRVVLLAAALTYETIPPVPWATTVKAVLEGLFHEQPHGSTTERVREHYLAYHSAHPFIGCRDFADCPVLPPQAEH